MVFERIQELAQQVIGLSGITIAILSLRVFCTVDLFIKNIHRLTIKTKIDAENK